tara:strand:+ start:1333 stop:1674 length:342 start_codon:yes stop_codon:yes gene_type:complete
MEDGRFVSNYLPNGLFENKLQESQNIKTNASYRSFLTHNATAIMSYNKVTALRQNMTMEFTPVLEKNHGPFVFDTIYSESRPQGYETNKAKILYLNRLQLNSMKFKRVANVKM